VQQSLHSPVQPAQAWAPTVLETRARMANVTERRCWRGASILPKSDCARQRKAAQCTETAHTGRPVPSVYTSEAGHPASTWRRHQCQPMPHHVVRELKFIVLRCGNAAHSGYALFGASEESQNRSRTCTEDLGSDGKKRTELCSRIVGRKLIWLSTICTPTSRGREIMRECRKRRYISWSPERGV
jgi:hypothetical protein